jgi:predicted metal-dependent peptidase
MFDILERFLNLPSQDRDKYILSLSKIQQNNILQKIIDLELTSSQKERLSNTWDTHLQNIMMHFAMIDENSNSKDIWYSMFLQKLDYEVDFNLNSPAATYFGKIDYVIVVNPKFFVTLLSMEQQIAILKHEAYHIINHHFERMIDTNLFNQKENTTSNIAADIAINQSINSLPLDKHILAPYLPKSVNLSYGKSFEFYYVNLIKPEFNKQIEVLYKQSYYNIVDSSHKYTKDKTIENHIEDTNLDSEKLQELIETIIVKMGEKIEILIMETSDDFVADYSKDRLRSTQFFDSYNSKNMAIKKHKPKLDWKKELKRFIVTKVKKKVSSFSRRHLLFPDEPMIAGKTHRYEGKKVGVVVVVLDTSASMSDDDLIKSFNEIRAIARVQKVKIKLILADSSINGIIDVDKDTDILKYKGGGGTYMFPAVDFLLNKLYKAQRRGYGIKKVDGIIILTDGGVEGGWEIEYDFPILWAVTTDTLYFDIKPYKKHHCIFIGGT